MDSVGALFSATLLGVAAEQWEGVLGVPRKILLVLASTAFVFAVYSFTSYLFCRENWRPFLKTIAFANLAYCFTTIGVVVYLHKLVTQLGFLYFTLEVALIASLAIIELKTVARRTNYKL